MTTPSLDLTGYVDLTLYDVDLDGLVTRALDRVTTIFPDWTPREGNIEVVLLEAVALEVQELTYAINRLPSAVAEGILRLYGLEPDAGSPATADVTFTVQNIGETTIPAGTSVGLVLPGGLEPVVFRTDADLVVPAGASTATTAATATRATTDPAGTPPGTTAVLLDGVAFVNTVTLTVTSSGVEPEDADAFLDRGVARLKRLSAVLVKPEHYTAAALEVPAVSRAATLDRYDPTQDPPTGRRGHVTVAVAGAAGLPLSTEDATALRATLREQGHSGITPHVTAPTVTAVNVAATLTRLPGYSREDVSAAATEALTGYLNPDAWRFGEPVYRHELIALLDRVEGVDRVSALTVPDADVTLPGVAALASVGIVNLTLP